jgi:aminopeptidase N
MLTLKKSFSFFVFILFIMTIQVSAQPPVEPGVPLTLARWRAAHYSDVRYRLNITLEKGAALMKGEIEIRVTLDEEGAKNHLYLDWRVQGNATVKERASDKPYAYVVGVNDAGEILTSESNEHIIITDGLLKKGENIIKIKFASPIATSGSAITRYIDREDNSEYIYSLFVPSDASTAFPCFDQPDLKARFKLLVRTSTIGNVVSNTELEDGVGVANGVNAQGKYETELTYIFKETQPISTYLFAFAAGQFEELQEDSGMNVFLWSEATGAIPPKQVNKDSVIRKIYVRKSQKERMRKEAKEVFRLNRECIKFLEKYFDYKFPFPKYDLVLIPEFPFRGMEHAGATFLREESILFPTDPTANDYLTRAGLIFHEAAHQWFGDLVTMKWFDDLWLKEGFAEFMAYKTIEATMPEFNAWKAFYERNKPLAYLTDSTKGTTPIYQEIPNLSSAKSAYGNIVYRKAPSFLRQAEFFLGADVFQKAIRAFVKKHAYKNAEWSDLVKAFEESSKQDLKAWADAWVKKRGMPSVTTEYFPTDKTDLGIMFSQKDVLNEGGIWTFSIKALLVYADGERKTQTISLTNDDVNKNLIPLWLIKNYNNRKIAFIFPNYGDYGYGRFLLDEKSRAYVMQHIGTEKEAFLRSMLWGSLWDSVREAELAPKDYVSLVIKNITIEKDEVTIQAILNRVSTAFTYYLSDAQSKELAPQVEKVLRERMLNAETLGQRITFYRAFLSIASTDVARDDLKKLLRGKLKINGMTLRARDKADIITKLIVLNDKDAVGLLNEFSKTETSDDAKRYAYAAAAAIATSENKKKYFDDFTNNPNVAESWIESAFVIFNTTRQAELTQAYLESALKELPKLKRTRKIFFVNGWLAAFIGGQKTEQTLKVVQKFIEDEKSLDKDLHLKVLEAVDGLERTVKIRSKFF